MAESLEKGPCEQGSWAREAEEYLLRLEPECRQKWLAPLQEQLGRWQDIESKIRKSYKGPWSDHFPWIWEMQKSTPERGMVKKREFDSIQGFLDCLNMRHVEPNRTQIVLVNTEESRTRKMTSEMIRKKEGERFDWSTSVLTLALLGSRWGIAPEVLFPVKQFTDNISSSGSKTRVKTLEREQIMHARESLRLPSIPYDSHSISTNNDQWVTETLFLAATLTPARFSEAFLNAFKAYYNPPDYQSLRLIRVSRKFNNDKVVDMYLVICDSQELREALSKRFITRSPSSDGSPAETSAVSRGNSPDSLMLSCKQHVIDRLCYNLNWLKTSLGELNYNGRKDPSYNKINYALHLRDHLEMAKRFLDYSTKELLRLPNSDSPDPSDAWRVALKGDQDYLRTIITGLEKEVEHVQRTIMLQIDSKNGSRNILFAVLASFYLPFSLATGVFGMNISEINDGTPQWSAVVAFGLPLALLTVAVPLGFNSAYHKITDFAVQRPRLFRAIAWLGIAISIAVVIVILVVVTKVQK